MPITPETASQELPGQPKKRKINWLFIAIIAGAGVLATFGLYWFDIRGIVKEESILNPNYSPISRKACTLEAKLCPDGSSVGRVGPNCEFAACPGEDPAVADWQTYRNEGHGFEVKYPREYKIESAAYGPGEAPGGVIYRVSLGGPAVKDFEADFSKGLTILVARIEEGLRNGSDPLAEPNGMDPFSQKDAVIDGQKARIYNGGEVYTVAKGGYEYLLIRGDEADQTTRDIFVKMVSTFKFTK